MGRRFHRGFTAAEKTELWDRLASSGQRLKGNPAFMFNGTADSHLRGAYQLVPRTLRLVWMMSAK
jgi:hypothetical protein